MKCIQFITCIYKLQLSMWSVSSLLCAFIITVIYVKCIQFITCIYKLQLSMWNVSSLLRVFINYSYLYEVYAVYYVYL